MNLTKLFVWGCLTEANFCLMWRSSHNLLKLLTKNWVSLFETNTMGILNQHTMFLQTNFFTFWVVMVTNSSASIHFVKCSMATTKYFSCLRAVRKGPRRSTPHWLDGHIATSGSYFAEGFLGTWVCLWCLSYLFTRSSASAFIVGQK